MDRAGEFVGGAGFAVSVSAHSHLRVRHGPLVQAHADDAGVDFLQYGVVAGLGQQLGVRLRPHVAVLLYIHTNYL